MTTVFSTMTKRITKRSCVNARHRANLNQLGPFRHSLTPKTNSEWNVQMPQAESQERLGLIS
ncbi:hypothetical protein CEE69_26900 [Rhodopirellula bahusiensis]|uniref:Uncharacterized protein n=1 Tax=Rhodopirellula bahusiensis TaxID=2014065 RepID=A0A2G1VZM9_9BACT|nr:hypothetical protein CEE69_26900 [Rhodopirellula bahusiensis]